ncbi:N-acetylmuramoyl-L-alanine amidase, partial [Tyzzerella sp. OttesenSCG-928-J15]|nr:N-acetylmuramoyl-L-alanine amidase [Tyzzerella sp. OttesenSCG-928-J15]
PDNRLVVDFYGAEMKVSQTELIPSSAAAYRKIRVAQNQLVPEKITRIVLELQNAVNYSIVLSADRRTLSIDFEQNSITDVSYSTDGIADYITITGQRLPTVNISNLTGPDRLVIDMPYSQINPKEIPVFSRFLTTVRAAQFESNTARVVLDLADRVKYSTEYSGNSVTIKIEEPTYKNIWYDNDTKTIKLLKDPYSPISAQSIVKTDRYSKYQYIFTLPGNYTGIYGYGDYEINDSNVRSVNIETINNTTQITVNERKVFEAIITEDNNYIYISLKNPKEVYSKIVVIDPGHGGNDPGTSGAGVQEKVLTLDISMRLLDLLNSNYNQTGIKVYATRTDDTYMSRFDRGPYANEIGDLFVSVHINSAAPNTVPSGTETYFHPHSNDSTIGITTEQTANIFHKHLLSTLNPIDRKVKENTYTVLLETKIPSVLCEIGFISNAEEAEKLKDPAYRQATAQALYSAIIETFSVYNPAR